MTGWRFARWCAGVILFVLSGSLSAHLTPNSEVVLSIGPDAVSADIVVPQGEYAFGTGNPVGNDPAALAQARSYLARHFAVTAADGHPWRVDITRVAFEQIAGPPDLHATALLTPPTGAATRQFAVRWTSLLSELPNHFALFVLASDPRGKLGDEREVLGAVRAGNTVLQVDRGKPSQRVEFANAMMLGIAHILGGYDHLLFVLALLLPAPLVARARRWREQKTVRATLAQLFRIVTAFTIGHSLTLVGAALGGWHLPRNPVEIAIALSVLVSGLHAIRPLFPGREHYVALGFGLVHGLAFATLLRDAGAGATSSAISLLGFNLGIEVVQIGIVMLVVPPLLALARTTAFFWLRTILATAVVAAAIAWTANRAFGLVGGIVAISERVIAHGLWAVAALYLVALVSVIRTKKKGGPAGPPSI